MTTCPRCGHSQDGGAECKRCGVIFAKARKRPAAPPPADAIPAGMPVFEPLRRKVGILLVLAILIGGARFGWKMVRRAERRTAQTQPVAAPEQLLAWESSNPEGPAIGYAMGHPELKAEIGAPLFVPKQGESNVTSNGRTGSATIRLRVTGRSNMYTHATVSLVREQSDWSVTDLTYDPPSELPEGVVLPAPRRERRNVGVEPPPR